MRTLIVSAAVALGLGLSACGGSGEVSNTTGPGVYSTEKDGVKTEVQVPTGSGDETVLAIEAYAKEVGVSDTYTFLWQTLTNGGTSEAMMCDPRIVTEAGTTVTFQRAFMAVAKLRNAAGINEPELYNKGVDIENALPEGTALPGATTKSLYVTTDALPSIKSVTSGYTSRELMGQGCDVQMEKTADAAPAVGETGSVASAAESPDAIVGISPEDLAVGLPTVSELSEAQGSTFVRKANYPMWTQATPLSKQRRDGAEFGNVRETTPQRCTSITYFFRGGIPQRFANPAAIDGVGFVWHSARNNNLGKKIYEWTVAEYLTTNDLARTWQSNAAAVADECKAFSRVNTNGEIQENDVSDLVHKSSGDALVLTMKKLPDGGRTHRYWISEAIGDVLYVSFLEADSSKLSGVTALYNQKANALASLQGEVRPDIDLANLQPFKSDPSTFVEVPLP